MAGRRVNNTVGKNVDKYEKYVDKVKYSKLQDFLAIVNKVYYRLSTKSG